MVADGLFMLFIGNFKMIKGYTEYKGNFVSGIKRSNQFFSGLFVFLHLL